MKNIKTYKGWNESREFLHTYLKAGDFLDGKLIKYLTTMVPLVISTNNCIQVPYDFLYINGKDENTCITILKKKTDW